jgi:hypothetical protein
MNSFCDSHCWVGWLHYLDTGSSLEFIAERVHHFLFISSALPVFPRTTSLKTMIRGRHCSLLIFINNVKNIVQSNYSVLGCQNLPHYNVNNGL